MASTPKSTVHAAKGMSKQQTQRFLPIAEIHNDAVVMKNGGLRAILEIEAVNFNLKSETEQAGIISGYGSFVNTLAFPVQIFIRSARTNIDEYLEKVRVVGAQNTNPLLQQQSTSYINFMKQLLEVADIMQKKFYLVIPLDHSVRKKTLIEQFMDWINPDSAKSVYRGQELNEMLRQVNERVELVQTGLGAVGLRSTRLSTRDLIELYYQIYNPKTSQTEKIPGDLGSLNLDNTHV